MMTLTPFWILLLRALVIPPFTPSPLLLLFTLTIPPPPPPPPPFFHVFYKAPTFFVCLQSFDNKGTIDDNKNTRNMQAPHDGYNA